MGIGVTGCEVRFPIVQREHAEDYINGGRGDHTWRDLLHEGTGSCGEPGGYRTWLKFTRIKFRVQSL